MEDELLGDGRPAARRVPPPRLRRPGPRPPPPAGARAPLRPPAVTLAGEKEEEEEGGERGGREDGGRGGRDDRGLARPKLCSPEAPEPGWRWRTARVGAGAPASGRERGGARALRGAAALRRAVLPRRGGKVGGEDTARKLASSSRRVAAHVPLCSCRGAGHGAWWHSVALGGARPRVALHARPIVFQTGRSSPNSLSVQVIALPQEE